MSCLITVLANVYLFNELLVEAKIVGAVPGSPFMEYLEGIKYKLMVVGGASMLLSSTVIIIFGLILSHRIAGPIYHLKNHIQRILKGDKAALENELNFREKDFFVELSVDVNNLIKYFKDRHENK